MRKSKRTPVITDIVEVTADDMVEVMARGVVMVEARVYTFMGKNEV